LGFSSVDISGPGEAVTEGHERESVPTTTDAVAVSLGFTVRLPGLIELMVADAGVALTSVVAATQMTTTATRRSRARVGFQASRFGFTTSPCSHAHAGRACDLAAVSPG
jgi:hypothetical protein